MIRTYLVADLPHADEANSELAELVKPVMEYMKEHQIAMAFWRSKGFLLRFDLVQPTGFAKS